MEIPIIDQRKGRYNFIVGIDLGAYSTSFSFAHTNNISHVINVNDWPSTSRDKFDGRVASSILYRNEDDVPFWGGNARKIFYRDKTNFFYAPQVKFYLTDCKNQPPIPGIRLTPIKLVSDYLKQVHEHGLFKMQEYLQELTLKMSNLDYNVPEITNDQICYVFSCPDDQKNTDYQVKIKNALKMAGIITPNDPKDKLRFITESEATAFFCTTLSSEMKVSPDPYLVCNVGDTLGLCTVEVSELPETAKVTLLDGQARISCGSLELDRNMREYLKDNVTSSPKDSEILKRFHDRLFEFYIENIKLSFYADQGDVYCDLTDHIIISKTTIRSRLINDGSMVFPYEDMKKYIFDPVTTNILRYIEIGTYKFERKITGLFLCGTIGQDNYLSELARTMFGGSTLNIFNIVDHSYVVSEGLIIYGSEQHNTSVPHFINKERKQKNFVRLPGNDNPLFNDEILNGTKDMDNVDMVIGIDFGEFESSMSYAPVPVDYQYGSSDHTRLIKDVSGRKHCYSKTPSILYYSSRMKYQNKFGYYAEDEGYKWTADGKLLRHFKPLVARDFSPYIDDKILGEIDDSELVDAISNYLMGLNKEGLRTIESRLGKKIEKDNLLYVIPVPHHWSKEANNTMIAAIKKSELVKHEHFDERVTIITDAEAIACYCKKYFAHYFYMGTDQQFMICNVEERSIGITVFKVVKEKDGQNNLILSEVISNGSEESTYNWIDGEFREFIITRFEESNLRYSADGIRKILNFFAREIKPNFELAIDPYIEDDIIIPLPISLNIPFDFEDPSGLIVDDCIVIPYDTLESKVFKPAAEAIIRNIYAQLIKLPKGERQLDSMLLVGNCGFEWYLLRQMKNHFEGRTIGATYVGLPPDFQLAISRGAVSFGLEPMLSSESFSRYSYYLQVRDIYRYQLDDPEQKVVGYDGQEYCPNIFSEVIAKGTKITKGSVCIQRVFVTYPNNFILAIYSSDESIAQKPSQQVIDSLISSDKLQVKTRDIPELKEGDKMEFEIWFEIIGSYMHVDVYYDGEVLKHDTVKIKTVTRPKYIRPNFHRKKQEGNKNWKTAIFSLMK